LKLQPKNQDGNSFNLKGWANKEEKKFHVLPCNNNNNKKS